MAKSFKDLQKSMVAFNRGTSPRVREMTRDAFFDGRQDVSADRLARRAFQEQRTTDFKNKFTKQVPNTGGTLLQMTSDAPRSLTAERERLANQYGPTFREIGSDIGYGLGSIAKGFAEKGTPLISLLKGLYDKGKDFVTQGIPNALRGESQFVVPKPNPFSSEADAIGGAFVGPTFNDQKINTQSLDSIFLPTEMSNEQFDEEFPFLPERTVNLDNLPFKAKPNVSNQYNLANARADNVGINLIGQLQNLQNLAQKYNLDKIQFDPFNPNSIGYKDQFMFNNTPVNYNIGIGDQGVEGGLSFAFKDGGSVDKYSGLGYKLK